MLSIKVKMVFSTIFHVPKSTHLCGPLFNGLSTTDVIHKPHHNIAFSHLTIVYLCVKNKEDLFSWF